MLAGVGLALGDLAGVGLAYAGHDGHSPRHVSAAAQPAALALFSDPAAVAEAFGLPTTFANDANAAAYGEFWVGSGQKFHSIVLLTLGTGVGGGIIIGDLSVDGENSHGSECGHIIIDNSPTARMCGCGQPGHLEAYCSATALVKRTHELLAAGRASSLTARISPTSPLTALMIAQEADRGDALANRSDLRAGDVARPGLRDA